MDYTREEYVEMCREFFEAYIKFRLEGTEKHWIKHNNRNIQINFFDHGDFLTVKLYCPEVLKSLSGYYNHSARNTEEIIRMILWLVFDSEELYTYEIETKDPEKEYSEIKEILIERYRLCYDAIWEDDHWKGTGEERFIIEFHDREIEVHFYPNAMWETNGFIDVNLFCLDTGRSCSTVVNQEEENPEDIIRLIQDMALEPESIEFSTADSEWEHDLLRDALVGRKEEEGLDIVRHPFANLHYIWEGDIIADRYLNLHNRLIKIQFEPNGRNLDIILNCLTTGKSYKLELSKESEREKLEEVCEEMIYRIQELAWETI